MRSFWDQFISLRDCDRVWLWNYNRFRVLHAVDSLNVKHELRSKNVKSFCILQTFPNDISLFATWKSCLSFCLNFNSWRHWTALINGRSIQTLLSWGVITTRSNRMKFRLLKVTLLSWMSFAQLLAIVESPLWKWFILFNYILVLCVFFRRQC